MSTMLRRFLRVGRIIVGIEDMSYLPPIYDPRIIVGIEICHIFDQSMILGS
jgi:hypothetical protein